ncbi:MULTISPECIES: hypothetical protein [Paraburkholderia]|uniref:Uncharacterized protein n=1 Tax=Paraburkholderia podalyriae TaxID=1938811 RepID=A0ABR7PN30_9BURK|nr:hypothetical protein [Paraburkholderia podalyriae]MBC8747780.1 hypothetical protein [Paraburkholderia podalyriae]
MENPEIAFKVRLAMNIRTINGRGRVLHGSRARVVESAAIQVQNPSWSDDAQKTARRVAPCSPRGPAVSANSL